MLYKYIQYGGLIFFIGTIPLLGSDDCLKRDYFDSVSSNELAALRRDIFLPYFIAQRSSIKKELFYTPHDSSFLVMSETCPVVPVKLTYQNDKFDYNSLINPPEEGQVIPNVQLWTNNHN